MQSDEIAEDSESGNEIDADHDAFLDLPREIRDPFFSVAELNTHHRCRHGEAPQRKVAFDMAATGRRFLGCPRQGADRCSFVAWVDDPWNPVLTRSLMRLWSLAGLGIRDGIPTFEPETPMDQSFLALWAKKNNMRIAFDQMEHSFITKEFKLKEVIRRNSEKATRRLSLYANLCISAVSVAVTVFALLVVLLLR
ncbi:hypothetical protein QYE76_039680 [Lolium multiflorum]|uniref:GRF-type domain-containing protein n=1 Tax=Lolium multiflorum TaxID=4521 RepID=A0AAD8TBK2_LOLMU|nr:hypothetical protein QYE76_039680 [Lolium multiflorum]